MWTTAALASFISLAAFSASSPPPQYGSTKSCASACTELNKALPGQVTTANNAAEYRSIQAGYYSAFNGELSPACFVLPTKAEDVATVVKVAKKLQCPFAVKGGGHTFFAGANSIQDGISVDLQRLNQVTPNADGSASIGPGNRWGQVYETLDPLGKTVMGGRVSSVGVGGLLVSGGLSFLHPSRGFGCDNIRGYQLVNAEGKVLEVTQKSYPDLFWALRGGGNNFGVVTRFDVDTVQQGSFWGGSINYNISQLDSLMKAYNRLAQPETQDIKATTWFAPVYFPQTNFWLINVEPVYADPVATTPEIFKPFVEAPDQLSNSIRIANISSLTRDTTPVAGSSQAEWDITMKMNTEVVHYMKERIETGALSHPAITQIAFPVQILGKPTLSHTGNRGGNALGLSPADGPLLITQLGLTWNATESAADDAAIIAQGDALMADVKKWSERKGLAHRYIYMNYAGKSQDVFAGYGASNQAKLRRIAKKYDPQGVFQKLVPGGKKLF
ncbi:Putative FAD-binding domain, PCMH-type, FAD-binding, type PCMH, subdomain 1 [Septoria linicola]|uniref:FAD-binding domain, PCMH-type, FAD-binding, type PCMH, subdomain 1 n=1 Tax=Septoria linicola TaxID=215465 RepID=A0A9Q9AVR5_9PEZI|nr:putative FAD-binding domain, PCMH-type, FAD-binding, type PCMH, subdomain 1 [Septoria linicola]USW52993.1 Putative FAD-binding domain, PCMH-type, FAD-binding, type PCMH, subdomain 1 [Septoria linicola]